MVAPEASVLVTETALPSRWAIEVTFERSTTLEPWPSTSSWQRSHIIPGPYLGYWNSSIRLVTCLDLSRRAKRPRIGSHTASHSDMPLMRWEPQSAALSDGGTPHPFAL